MAEGKFGYFQSNDTVHKADAVSTATSRCCGAHVGVDGKLLTKGSVPSAWFSDAGPTPSPGAPVYLARDADDIGGAAGKVTAQRPTAGIIAQVGLVVSVDPLTFPATRRAHVLLQIKDLACQELVGVEPTGPIDGVNMAFTTPSYFSESSLRVYLNGQRLRKGASADYVVSESGGFGSGFDTITLAIPPRPLPNPDVILVDYTET